MTINSASTPSSLLLSHLFLLLVFIKLFLNFVYLFALFDEVLHSPPTLCPSAVCFSLSCLPFLTLNLRDLEDWPSFMGIPLSSKPGTASPSSRGVVFPMRCPGLTALLRSVPLLTHNVSSRFSFNYVQFFPLKWCHSFDILAKTRKKEDKIWFPNLKHYSKSIYPQFTFSVACSPEKN